MSESEAPAPVGSDALVRPWEAQSFLERTIRSKLSIARNTIETVDRLIPPAVKAQNYADAARMKEQRIAAKWAEKDALNLLELYEIEFHRTNVPTLPPR